MKNIMLMFLVATIPFMSIAQKRSNKKSNARMGEMGKKTPSPYEYMIIKGVESTTPEEEKMMSQGEVTARAGAPGDVKMKSMIKSRYKHFVRFDTGKITPEQIELNKMARVVVHMSNALTAASKLGWEFINASHVSNEDFIIHYYYMRRAREKK
jgi:hypothetical protein